MIADNTRINKRKVDLLDPELGNTKISGKRLKRATLWKKCVFTLNNYTQNDIKCLIGSFGSVVPILCFQEEDEGTPHLQGFMEFAVKKRPIQYWSPIMGHKKTSFRKMKGSIQQNMAYCTDEDKRIPNGIVYTRGCPRPLVRMTYEHLTKQQQEIVDKYKEFEDPLFGREIHWYWEPEGEWGKTKTQKYMFDNMDATMVGGTKHDMFYALSQLVLLTGECPPIVIINLVKDTDMKYVSYAGMESIKDGCFFSKKFKSGMCRFNSPHLLVFANEPPDMSRFTKGTTNHRCQVFPLTEDASSERWCDWVGV